MRADDLTVVIPTRERWEILRRTLDALATQSTQGFETVVVVDGADQEPPDLGDGIRVLRKEHAGPGAARNHGVAATDRRLVAFLGDDMVPTSRLVEHHLRWHDERPEERVAVLGHVDWHPDVARNRILRWLDWSGTQFDYCNLAGHAGEDVGFGRFYSCNVSLKRSLFEEVGGFDEDFVYYYEDLDLGYRLGQAGMELIYEPAAVAHHLQDYDLDAVRRRFQGIAVGERLMAHKHPWFDPPFFHARVHRATQRPPASAFWARIVDLLPHGTALRRQAEREADAWYHQQVAGAFFEAWERASDSVESHG